MIYGENIVLRKVRNVDIPIILSWENNPEFWEVSETEKAYTFDEIILLADSSEDIYENGQLRFLIEMKNKTVPIGAIDLFQTDFNEKSAHIGILIANKDYRLKGLASESIEMLAKYCHNSLQLESLYCTIHSTNQASINLFKKSGFEILMEEKQNVIFDTFHTIKMKRCLKK